VTIRPAVGKDFVDPQFEERRCAVPLHRVLPDNQIGASERLLFGGDVDVKIRIKLIEGTYLYVVKCPYLFKHALIRMGVMRIGMRINYQNHQLACLYGSVLSGSSECRHLTRSLKVSHCLVSANRK